MFQTDSRNSAEIVVLSIATIADDYFGHHSHDLQSLQKLRTVNFSLHPAISNSNDDEPQPEKIIQKRFLAPQKRTHLHHHLTHDQLKHPSARLHQRLHLPPPAIIGHQN